MALKSQSAMEYLMTYGWAVLAIAIVIIALFQLGVFGGNNLTPHSTSGACQAVHTAAGSSLAGQCNSAQPKFVGRFNGVNSYVQVSNFPFAPTTGFTFSAWANTGTSSNYQFFIGDSSANYRLGISPSRSIYVNFGDRNDQNPPISLSVGTWYYLTMVGYISSGTLHADIYVNGAYKTTLSTASTSFYGISEPLRIGAADGPTYYVSGSIADVQIYNTSLSSSEIASLYQEGIGGVPIDPSHIVGWWPLNGNAQDYSGDNNNGQAINVGYNSTWSSGYVQP